MWQDSFNKPVIVLALFAFGMAVIPINDALIKLMSVYLSLGQILYWLFFGLCKINDCVLFSKIVFPSNTIR